LGIGMIVQNDRRIKSVHDLNWRYVVVATGSSHYRSSVSNSLCNFG